MEDLSALPPADLVRKIRESDALVTYLRSVVEAKDERIAQLDEELRLRTTRHAEALESANSVHDAAAAALRDDLAASLAREQRLRDDLGTLTVADRENGLLRAQAGQLKGELANLRAVHAEELQALRADATRTRATLSAEFHVQLEEALREKAHEGLLRLPQRAREALAERELLRFQLADQDRQIYEACARAADAEKRVRDAEFERRLQREEAAQTVRHAAVLRRRLTEAEARLAGVTEALAEHKGQAAALQVLSSQLRDAQARLAAAEEERSSIAYRFRLAYRGLQRACEQAGVSADLFYTDRKPASGRRAAGAAVVGSTGSAAAAGPAGPAGSAPAKKTPKLKRFLLPSLE